MRARQSFALSSLVLLFCAAVALCQGIPDTKTAQAAQANQSGLPVEIPLATASRLERAKDSWWPTKKAASREDFVGNQACVGCHSEKTASQVSTPMARAARLAQDTKLPPDHPALSAKRGRFSYSIAPSAAGPSYSVTDRTTQLSLSATILWAFGAGQKGQTYIYLRDREYYESEMSYYSALGNLDVTTGHEQKRPETLEDALGTLEEPPAAQKCFACHTTGATTVSGGFAPENAAPGVTCEACHGPGGTHVVVMQQLQGEAATPGKLQILNPHSLSPIESVDFCGSCHRTWADVYEMEAGVTGPVNSRFQAYRLENSKCWGEGDARLTCVACHDPHQQLQHEAAVYDQKCLACHPSAKAKSAPPSPAAPHPPRPCPVASVNCVTCHMPKVNVEVMHSDFTDHRIRIVRKGEPYPD